MTEFASRQSPDRVDCIVVGAGVIGLSIGRALALVGREVIVIESNDAIGLETSARNSEVIHAGIHYPAGSLKARMCRTGRRLLLDYLARKAIPHRLVGKIIVAPDEGGEPALAAIEAKAIANGVTSLVRLGRSDIASLEPELRAHSGLLSPETGIFDSRAFLLALAGDIGEAGGSIALATRVTGARKDSGGWVVATTDRHGQRFDLSCRQLVNAAGLRASELAAAIHAGSHWQPPVTRFARGTYVGVSGPVPFARLVYPVPEPGGLGIHLTLDMAGAMRFGPDVAWIEAIDYALPDDESRLVRFALAIGRYWPGIAGRNLSPLFSGIRPKITRAGELDADFLIAGPEIHGADGLVHLFGIESPGLTSSLAIAGHVAEMLGADQVLG